MKKVSDEHILEYIWDETLSHVASSTIINYIGDNIGTYSEDEAAKDAEMFAVLNINDLVAGSGLSKGRFKRKVEKLIRQSDLLSRLGSNSFIINSLHLEVVATQAVRNWQAVGVPCGIDTDGKSRKTMPISGLPRSIFELKTNCYLILRSQFPNYY